MQARFPEGSVWHGLGCARQLPHSGSSPRVLLLAVACRAASVSPAQLCNLISGSKARLQLLRAFSPGRGGGLVSRTLRTHRRAIQSCLSHKPPEGRRWGPGEPRLSPVLAAGPGWHCGSGPGSHPSRLLGGQNRSKHEPSTPGGAGVSSVWLWLSFPKRS